mgnify:CR=1 FL=1
MNTDLFRATLRKYMELRHIRTLEQLRAHTTVGSSTTFRKYYKERSGFRWGCSYKL